MISVCIATYNGEQFIEEQILSILNQLKDNDEILISDDGSTDGTLAIIKSFHDKRIKVLPPPIRCGLSDNYKEFSIIYKVATNFLNALKHAKGDSIYFCDQDDVWLPNKVDICERNLINNAITVHRRIDVDSNLNPIHPITSIPQDNRKATFIQSLRVSHFQGACFAFTKDLKEKILNNIDLFYSIPLSQDHAIGYVAMAYFCDKVHFEPQQLILYRRHGGNVSPTGEKK